MPSAKPTVDIRSGEAFAGLKVADFSWVAVGPITGQGAGRPRRDRRAHRVVDARRLRAHAAPFKDNVVGINRSHFMNNLNTSKLGVALNFATPEGRELARTAYRLGRRGGRELHAGNDEAPGLRLRDAEQGPAGPDHDQHLPHGPDGALGVVRRLRTAGRGNLRLPTAITGWPDRPPVGPVRSLLGRHCAALQRRRARRRDPAPPPDRRRPAHRRLAGREPRSTSSSRWCWTRS